MTFTEVVSSPSYNSQPRKVVSKDTLLLLFGLLIGYRALKAKAPPVSRWHSESSTVTSRSRSITTDCRVSSHTITASELCNYLRCVLVKKHIAPGRECSVLCHTAQNHVHMINWLRIPAAAPRYTHTSFLFQFKNKETDLGNFLAPFRFTVRVFDRVSPILSVLT